MRPFTRDRATILNWIPIIRDAARDRNPPARDRNPPESRLDREITPPTRLRACIAAMAVEAARG